MTKHINIYEHSQETHDAAVDSLIGEIPALGTVFKSIQYAYHLKQLHSLKRFIEAANIDDKYLNSLSAEPDLQDLFYEFARTSSKTYNPIACVALALVFRDDALSNSRKTNCMKSLEGISKELTDFLLHEIFQEGKSRNEDDRALNLIKFIPDKISAFNTASELLGRMICSRSSILGDIGHHVHLTDYTFFIIGRLQQAVTFLEQQNDQ